MGTKDIADETVVQVVRECRTPPFLRDVRTGEYIGPTPLQLLQERTGQPRKVCLRAMERAQRRMLIDGADDFTTAWPLDLISRNSEVIKRLSEVIDRMRAQTRRS